MKILHYTHVFSPPSQSFIYDVIRRQCQRDYEVHVITKRRVNSVNRPFERISVVNGFPVISPTKFRLLYDLGTLHDVFTCKLKLKSEIERFAPQLIHCHFGWSAIDLVCAFDNQWKDMPMLVSFHGSDVLRFPDYSRRYVRTVRLLADQGVLFSCPSKFLAAEACERFSIPAASMSVIPNSFNSSLFTHREAKNEASVQKKVLCVARFVKWKGHSLLLESFKKLLSRFPEAQLRLVGSGSEMHRVKRKVADEGMSNNVVFLGDISHGRVAEEMTKADLYVQPSIVDPKTRQTESFGVAALEAVSIGVPTVVTEVGGLSDTLQGGFDSYAIVCSPNAEDLSIAMARALSEESQIDGLNEYRNRVLNYYSESSQDARIDQLYKKLINEH